MSSPGKLIEGKTYPPGAYASGKMKKGQILRIIDVEGEQVADFITLRDGGQRRSSDADALRGLRPGVIARTR